jgi:signal transduction histidine kinase
LQTTLALLEKGVYGGLNDLGQQRISGAETSVGRLIGLINDLLDMEKMEAGMLKIDLQPCELSAIIERSLESLRGYADQKQVTIKSESTTLKVMGDEGRLTQVLVNLVSNAIKYAPAQSDIDVSVAQSGDKVEVRVIDRGPGIPPDQIGKIFDRFQQVEAPDRAQYGGSGLGLAICKSIITAHGGDIGVQSATGGPTTFWFSLQVV